MEVFNVIQNEIRDFIDSDIEISPGVHFSQYRTVKQIKRFESNVYESGNKDSQSNYKYWYDIISPRIDSEVKNIDFDTKDILLSSDSKNDSTRIFIAQSRLKEWMRDTGQAKKLNDSIEEYSGMGNIVWKKTQGKKSKEIDYDQMDLLNFYVINQQAENLNDTPVIERHILSQAELRAQKGVWDDEAIDYVLKNCADKGFVTNIEGVVIENKEIPYYEVFERNGEMQLSALKEAMGEDFDEDDKDVYVLSRVIVSCVNEGGDTGGTDNLDTRTVLFADTIKEMPYKEAHRGRYYGRWLRKGLFEILKDIQIRSNQIGNQISRALEFAGKQVFQTADKMIAQNILTDLQRGDIIRTTGLNRVDMNMADLGNFVNEWSLLQQEADKLSNSFEIVQGETPAGTPFRLGALLNTNANKFFGLIREKIGISFQDVIKDWILPEVLKDLDGTDVLRVTGDPEMLISYRKNLIESWYVDNLIAIGAHTKEEGEALKEAKLNEVQKDNKRGNSELVKLRKDYWKEFEPRVSVVITGENINLESELQTLGTFVSLETDPIRRTALIEKMYAKKGIDIANLPKTEQQPVLEGATQGQRAGATAPQPKGQSFGEPGASNLGGQQL